MNVEFIMSLLGADCEGLIRQLDQQTRDHGGHWLDSKFSQLDGQFSGLIRVSVAESRAGALREFFAAQPGLTVQFSMPAEMAAEQSRNLKLKIEARDKLGLINRITEHLLPLGVNITQLECRRISVIEAGSNMLSIDMELDIPATLEDAALVDSLDALEESMVVTLQQ
jgi:glycine cleavage system regulatory protein